MSETDDISVLPFGSGIKHEDLHNQPGKILVIDEYHRATGETLQWVRLEDYCKLSDEIEMTKAKLIIATDGLRAANALLNRLSLHSNDLIQFHHAREALAAIEGNEK